MADDTLASLQFFKESLNQLATQRALNAADQEVRRVKNEVTDEGQQRSLLQAIADQTALRLQGIGNTPEQVASAMKVIGPQHFATPEAAVTEYSLRGNKDMMEKAKAADIAAKAGERSMLDTSGQWDLKKTALAGEYDLAKARLGSKKDMPHLTTDAVKEITQVDADIDSGKALLSEARNNPNLVGIVAGRLPAREWLDPKYAGFKSEVGQWFDQYRVRVTGAGASPGELKILEKNRPNVKDGYDTFIEKVERAIKIGDRIRSRKMSNFEKAGYNVSGFTSTTTPGTPASTAATEPKKNGAVMEKTLKNGTKVRVIQAADGTYHEVK